MAAPQNAADESKRIAQLMRPFARACRKRTDVRYDLIDAPFATKAAFRAALKRPFTLVKYEAFAHLVSPSTRFVTKLPGDKQAEQRFAAKDVQGRVLVVGAVGEVYHASLAGKFVRGRDGAYRPVAETRRCVAPVDDRLFAMLRGALSERGRRAVALRVPTSWGAMHLVKRGDALVVDADGVYRVQGAVFAKTYISKPAGGHVRAHPCNANAREKKLRS